MSNTTEKLAYSKVQPGQMAPDFTLPNETGEHVTLSSFFGKSPVVLYFYPKDMTPGCTQESCDFRDAFPRFQSMGAAIFGISRDSVESHLKFKEKENLPFSLLADVDGQVCEAFGVWNEKSMYGRKYMGIDRTTIVIGQDGTILRVFEKVKVTGHVAEVESVLSGKAPEAAPATRAKPPKKAAPKTKAAKKAPKKAKMKAAKKSATKRAPQRVVKTKAKSKTRKMPKALKTAKTKTKAPKRALKKTATRSARARSRA